jgi:hypothetical protein
VWAKQLKFKQHFQRQRKELIEPLHLTPLAVRLGRSVKLLFQPAEEFGAGAKQMVEEGVLDGVDEVYGIHLITAMRTGTIGVKDGPLMAAPGTHLWVLHLCSAALHVFHCVVFVGLHCMGASALACANRDPLIATSIMIIITTSPATHNTIITAYIITTRRLRHGRCNHRQQHFHNHHNHQHHSPLTIITTFIVIITNTSPATLPQPHKAPSSPPTS